MASIPSRYAKALKLHQEGRLAEAEQLYQEILKTAPRHAESMHGLGVIQYQRSRPESALSYINRALEARPTFIEALQNKGAILVALGRLEESLATYQSVLQLANPPPEASANLGNVFRALGKKDEAVAHYRRNVELQPEFAPAHNSLGFGLQDLGRYAEAVSCHRKAIALASNFADAHSGLGKALCGLGLPLEAIDCFHEAIRLQPQSAEAYHDLGTALKLIGRIDESLLWFDRALAINPELAITHVNRSTSLLLNGDYQQGWLEYEWRMRVPELSPRNFSVPLWDGAPLGGISILLHTEQGLGDAIQFIRYAPLVKARGGHVIVLVPRGTIPLFGRCPGIDRIVDNVADLPPFERHVPLMSLPRLFETSLTSIPAVVPYLEANPELIERWTQRLAPLHGFRVGVCWQGNPQHPGDRYRSFPLGLLEPLAAIPGIQLVSLQRVHGLDQLVDAKQRFRIHEIDEDIDRESGLMMDTAAIMHGLDIVITADTAIAHLAGAMAIPVWLVLPKVPDWRWLMSGDRSAWYPTARLFRQQVQGDWSAVVFDLTTELKLEVEPQADHEDPPVLSLLSNADLSIPMTPETLVVKSVYISAAEASLSELLIGATRISYLSQNARRVVLSCAPDVFQLFARSPQFENLSDVILPGEEFNWHLNLSQLSELVPSHQVAAHRYGSVISPSSDALQRWENRVLTAPGLKVGFDLALKSPSPADNSLERDGYQDLVNTLSGRDGVDAVPLFDRGSIPNESACSVRFPLRSSDSPGSLDDLAALISHLDLVITRTRDVAHLAGALGIPCWLIDFQSSHSSSQDLENLLWCPRSRVWTVNECENRNQPVITHEIEVEFDSLINSYRCSRVRVKISPAELLDKITILQIKCERILDLAKLRHVRFELATLERSRYQSLPNSPELSALLDTLKSVNLKLWEVEDEIRGCEIEQEFGAHFIELARSVYIQNDRRAELKRSINDLLGSEIVEQKSYTSYAPHSS